MIFQTSQIEDIAKIILSQELIILPTDTIYGIHCLAKPELLNKVYKAKNRPETMAFITLISDLNQIEQFDITLSEFEKEQVNKYWPGANTLIFSEKSFRLPNNKFLINLMKITGPLISTSANIHKKDVIKNIHEGQQVFTDLIKYFVDGGELNNPPSSIYKVSSNQVTKIR